MHQFHCQRTEVICQIVHRATAAGGHAAKRVVVASIGEYNSPIAAPKASPSGHPPGTVLKNRTPLFADAVLEDGDPSLIAAGLGETARAIGVTEFARQTGLSRETIYKGFVLGGNPTLDTLAKTTKALGLRLTVAPVTGRHVA